MLKRMYIYLFIPMLDLAALFAMISIIMPVLSSIPPPDGQFLIPNDIAFQIEISKGIVKVEGHEFEPVDLEDAFESRSNRAAVIVLNRDTSFSEIEPVLRALSRSSIRHAGYKIRE